MDLIPWLSKPRFWSEAGGKPPDRFLSGGSLLPALIVQCVATQGHTATGENKRCLIIQSSCTDMHISAADILAAWWRHSTVTVSVSLPYGYGIHQGTVAPSPSTLPDIPHHHAGQHPTTGYFPEPVKSPVTASGE